MEPKFADHLHWELTRTADHEPDPSPSKGQRIHPRELETEEALAVAAALGRAGCRVVTLSGLAERSDWPQIAQVLARSGVSVRLITDGRRFGRIEARLARAAKVSTVLLRATDELHWMHVSSSRSPRRSHPSRETSAQLQGAAAGLEVAGVPYRMEDDRCDAHCGIACELAGPCEAGHQVLGLRSDGTITECLALPGAVGVGNVRHAPLPQLWRAAQTARAQRLAARGAPCVATPSAMGSPA